MGKKATSIKESSGYQAPAVQKAFQILSMVAESKKGMGLSELAQALEFSKSTTHGLIQALVKTGSSSKDPVLTSACINPWVVLLLNPST